MRTINELLIILRDNMEVKTLWFGLKKRITHGLCKETLFIFNENLIDSNEFYLLFSYIIQNRPNKNTMYSWSKSLYKPRIKWLNEQIELTKI